MIYVEEKDFNRQIKLLVFLASSQDLSICAWLYPESTLTKLSGFDVTQNPSSLVPVTTYENGFRPKCTIPISASASKINAFGSSYNELKINCDSLALYKNNETSWFAATIGHEGMCLIQDDLLLNILIQAGFSASTDVPNWW
jgi:hypothetical protein